MSEVGIVVLVVVVSPFFNKHTHRERLRNIYRDSGSNTKSQRLKEHEKEPNRTEQKQNMMVALVVTVAFVGMSENFGLFVATTGVFFPFYLFKRLQKRFEGKMYNI